MAGPAEPASRPPPQRVKLILEYDGAGYCGWQASGQMRAVCLGCVYRSVSTLSTAQCLFVTVQCLFVTVQCRPIDQCHHCRH